MGNCAHAGSQWHHGFTDHQYLEEADQLADRIAVIDHGKVIADGTSADPATMPGWLQMFVAANPVTHLVSAIRALMTGTATLQLIGYALLAPALLTAIFGPIVMTLYRRKR